MALSPLEYSRGKFGVRKNGRNAEQPTDDDCIAGCGRKRDPVGIALGDAAGGDCVFATLRLNFLPAARGAVARA